MSGATTTRILTLLRHCSFLTTILDYLVGTLMYLSSLIAPRGWHRSCVCQPIIVCFFLFLFSLACVFVVLSSRHLCSWICCPQHAFCLVSCLSHSLCPQIFSQITILLGQHTLLQQKLHHSWRLSAHYSNRDFDFTRYLLSFLRFRIDIFHTCPHRPLS